MEPRSKLLDLIARMWDYPDDPGVLVYLDGMKLARADAGRKASVNIARGLKDQGEDRDTDSLEAGLQQLQAQVENASEQQVRNYYDELDAWAASNDQPFDGVLLPFPERKRSRRKTLPEMVREAAEEAGLGHRTDELLHALANGLPPGADRELRELFRRTVLAIGPGSLSGSDDSEVPPIG